MNNTPVEQAWFEFVRDNTSNTELAVIFEREKGTRPQKPFATINFISGPLPIADFDEIRRNQSRDKFEIVGLRKYTVSIQVYGLEAVSILDELLMKLELPEVVLAFKTGDADIAIVERGGVVNVSALLETGFEERAALDIIFNTSKTITSDVKTIDKVVYEGQIEDGKTIIIGDTIE